MRNLLFPIALAVLASPAGAFEFRSRFVERVGNTDIVLNGDQIDLSFGPARRIRIQFGVFDNAEGAAPAGGFVGWNVGTIRVNGHPDNSVNTRTPGRLVPFVFSNQPHANGNPPLPSGDPFVFLDSIDATLGSQSPFWGCDANGNPLPQPAPVIRGRNTFVSVFEISTDPAVFATSYTIEFAGNLIAASEWRTVGTPFAPDCGDPADPSDDVAGDVTYAPFVVAPIRFENSLQVIIPAPGGAAALIVTTGLVAARRRRSAHT